MLNLKERRIELGLTMLEVANLVGVSEATISRYESGNIKNMRRDRIEKYAKALQVSPSDFLDLEEEKAVPADKLYVLDQGKIRQIPIYESVSAGFGASASDYVVDYMPLYIDSDSEAEETIGIKVVGNSMYPKIEEGDIIQVRKQSDVDSGKVAVVMIDGEDFVVKKFYHEGNKIILKSFNPEYPPKVFEGKEMARIQIVGLVRSVIKKL